MNELSSINNYGQFKEALGTELRNQAEGFVRTGYLLKVARDTDILRESGYATVAEFAQAEYGLSKDVVSRYIAINDKYSQDGYSEYLQDKYVGYGVAKLQEMLTLPDVVVDVLTPDITKRELLDVKREIKEEEQISDIEVMIEGVAPSQADMTLLQKFIHQYFHDNREKLLLIKTAVEDTMGAYFSKSVENMMDALAPSGIGILTARIQGVGKVMLSIKGEDIDMELVNVRAGEKETITWQQFIDEIRTMFRGTATWQMWEVIYGEPFENKEVAPVQPHKQENVIKTQENVIKTQENVIKSEVNAPSTLHNVDSSIPEPSPIEPVSEESEEVMTEDIEEQIPGQREINDYPEILPEKTSESSIKLSTGTTFDGKEHVLKLEKPENGIKLKCEADSQNENSEEEDESQDVHEIRPSGVKDISVICSNNTLDQMDRRNIWNEIVRSKELIGFFIMNNTEDDVAEGNIPKERYERIYKISIELAAGFEKLLADSEGGLK